MSLARHFLDFSQPALLSAADYLIRPVSAWFPGRHEQRDCRPARATGGTAAVGDSGRAGGTQGLLLSPPTLETVGQLPEHLYRAKRPFASSLTQQLAWARVLRDADRPEPAPRRRRPDRGGRCRRLDRLGSVRRATPHGTGGGRPGFSRRGGSRAGIGDVWRVRSGGRRCANCRRPIWQRWIRCSCGTFRRPGWWRSKSGNARSIGTLSCSARWTCPDAPADAGTGRRAGYRAGPCARGVGRPVR